MNTTARMKGNRSSAGETLPGAPLEWAPASSAAVTPAFESPSSAPKRRRSWRRRSILLPALALSLIGIAGLAIALFVSMIGGNGSDSATRPPGESPSAHLGLPGTPTPAAEPTVAPEVTEAATAGADSTAVDTATTGASPAASAPVSAAVPVRVRYEVLPGDNCDVLRQKFGFAVAELADFSTALSRVSGRTPANQCAFLQGDVICIPTPTDLEQLDQLTRDTGCMLGSTPATPGS